MENQKQEQNYKWANARTAAALLTGAPYIYVYDQFCVDENDIYGDLILVTWRGQQIVCPVPVVVEMLADDLDGWYADEKQNIPTLIGYAPAEYRERL